jgi:hypothetical protein
MKAGKKHKKVLSHRTKATHISRRKKTAEVNYEVLPVFSVPHHEDVWEVKL